MHFLQSNCSMINLMPCLKTDIALSVDFWVTSTPKPPLPELSAFQKKLKHKFFLKVFWVIDPSILILEHKKHLFVALIAFQKFHCFDPFITSHKWLEANFLRLDVFLHRNNDQQYRYIGYQTNQKAKFLTWYRNICPFLGSW